MGKTYGQKMARVKNPNYLQKQWNKYYVVMRIPERLRPFFVHQEDAAKAKKREANVKALKVPGYGQLGISEGKVCTNSASV